MVSGDDDLVFVGCGGEPGERGLELCLRSCLREVPGVYENVSRRKGRELGVAIVRVGDADDAGPYRARPPRRVSLRIALFWGERGKET